NSFHKLFNFISRLAFCNSVQFSTTGKRLLIYWEPIIAPSGGEQKMADNVRRIEITVLEHQRIVRRQLLLICPVCHLTSELLTVQEAGALARVKVQSIYRWLADGKVHGVRTPGGQHRICKDSLFSGG